MLRRSHFREVCSRRAVLAIEAQALQEASEHEENRRSDSDARMRGTQRDGQQAAAHRADGRSAAFLPCLSA